MTVTSMAIIALERGSLKVKQCQRAGYSLTVPPASDEPSPPEKTSQLERILASPTFKRPLKPARLLRVLVESDLAQRILDEDMLGVEVFERPRDWIPMDDSIVRENLRRLRNLLSAYYANDGVEDRLNLEISGYKPIFSYNIRHPFERQYRRALRHIGNDPKTAFSLLNSALGLEPGHAGALAAWAETELWRPLYGYDLTLPALMASAEGKARESLHYDSAAWRAHVVMGALHCCRKEWQMAAQAFEKALGSSPDETRTHPWYAAFLMATATAENARAEEALQLARARANEPSEAPWPQLTYAVFLYAARRFSEAKSIILETLKEHDENWLAHVMFACICLAQGRYTALVPGWGMSSPPSVAEGALVYPALSILVDVKELSPDYPEYLLVKSAMEEIARKKLAAWEPPQDAGGHSSIGDFCLSPCQLAIGYVAIGDSEKAIEMLGRDVQRDHPLMVWLHLWPLLDQLKEEPGFKRLIAQMHLPSQL